MRPFPPRRRGTTRTVPPLRGLLFTFVVLATLHAARAYGQGVLDPTLRFSQYEQRSWDQERGLPQNSVMSLVQRRDGYVWAGTQEGLLRFDGVRFTPAEEILGEPLPSDHISALLEDRAGTLWIGTIGGGLTRLRGDQLHPLPGDSIAAEVIYALHEDAAGAIWIGTRRSGLLRYSDGTYEVVATAEDFNGAIVLSLAPHPGGGLWIGTENGLHRLVNARTEPVPLDLPSPLVRALHVDPSGRLWIGTADGLASYHHGLLQRHKVATDQAALGIFALHADVAGTLWAGTTAGLLRVHADRFDLMTTEDGLVHPQIRALLTDREGGLWIGTDGGGLQRLHNLKFALFGPPEGLATAEVTSILEDRAGRMWMGTTDGLHRLDGDAITRFGLSDGLSSPVINALHEAHDGTLWVGTYDGGLCRLAPDASPRFRCFGIADGLPSTYVTSLHETADGTLWIGTDVGLGRYRGDRFDLAYTTEQGLGDNTVFSVIEADDALWVGTFSGISRIHDGEVETFGTEDGLLSEIVPALRLDATGRLWAGTYEGGLCLFDGSRFDCLTTTDGLPDNDVLQILEDGRGRLWLGTSQGIFQVDRDQLLNRLRGGPPVSGRQFARLDGLRSQDVMGGVQPTAWRSRDGRLWFATTGGAAVIDPDFIRINAEVVPVVVERINGGPLQADAPYEISAGASRDLVVEFTALSYTHPQAITFQHRLIPYDEDWKPSTSHRDATYTTLDPGTYSFQVRAANADGLWNLQGAAVTIVVEPFFWETPWFALLAGLVLVSIAAGGYHLHVRRLRHRHELLQSLVDEQTRELQDRRAELETLNANLAAEVQRQLGVLMQERQRYEQQLIEEKDKAEASARLKSTILRNMSHELRTPITAILGYSQILAEEVSEPLQEFADYINQNGERLLGTITSILDLAKLESAEFHLEPYPLDLTAAAHEAAALLALSARSKGLSIHVDAGDAPTYALAEGNALGRVLQNLVGNAVKFTERGVIVLRVRADAEGPIIEVQDTGIGISEGFLPHIFDEFQQESDGLSRAYEGSGLGLAITKRLVHAMGGSIGVESQRGEGTTFTIRLRAAASPRPHLLPPAESFRVRS